MLIEMYTSPGQTVWDGFMGRGTIGKMCIETGRKYVGVEELPQHVGLALDYLELAQS